jgi:hypothetical protein
MKKRSFFMVAVFFANAISPALLGGIPSDKAVYRGGTVAAVAESTEGAVTTTDEQYFVFQHKRGDYRIPYERVNFLEFGQKAGRRIGLAIAVSPVLLLSKKRRHFLTINFLDEHGKQQAMVFELGKHIVRTTLASLEARTGKRIEYQDDEARRAGRS